MLPDELKPTIYGPMTERESRFFHEGFEAGKRYGSWMIETLAQKLAEAKQSPLELVANKLMEEIHKALSVIEKRGRRKS